MWLHECLMRSIHYLFSQRPTGSLRMCPQHTRLHVLWFEVLLNLIGPQSARSSHLCYLHVEIHSNPPEERQARCKAVDIESGFQTWSERGKYNNMSTRWWPNSSLRWTPDPTVLRARSSKAPKGFRTRKSLAKSQTLWLQSCFIHIFLNMNRGSLYTRRFRRIHHSADKD